MATYKARGNAHNVIYPYKNEAGEQKQHWETYTIELEAIQRKAFIDYLQKNKRHAEILKAVIDYKRARAIERTAQAAADPESEPSAVLSVTGEDNTYKTYREFSEKWLPFIARKKRFSPNTYDSYISNLNNHILPYFGDRVMSTITAEDVDNFIDFLSRKPCKGHKGYGQNLESIPTLASPSIKKCYNIFTSGFAIAKKWRYITEIPGTTAPAEKTKKRKAWDSKQVFSILESIKDDPLLHLVVHLAFVCSLRAGETAGIDIGTIDFHDRSLWITQEVQRVSDKSLAVLPKNEIIRVFPKEVATAGSSLILKGPKTEGSHRKQYLTTPLLKEIRERLEQIKHNKEFFGAEYRNYGLLICRPDGRPIDPKSLNKAFKGQQKAIQIEKQIEFQGLRKSGQMHKVRLTKNNYQLVAESSGQSPEVLMSNYNEALDSEKRTLSLLVETSFYPQAVTDTEAQVGSEVETILQKIQNNPELSKQILQTLLLHAVNA
jgi:integrase